MRSACQIFMVFIKWQVSRPYRQSASFNGQDPGFFLPNAVTCRINGQEMAGITAIRVIFLPKPRQDPLYGNVTCHAKEMAEKMVSECKPRVAKRGQRVRSQCHLVKAPAKIEAVGNQGWLWAGKAQPKPSTTNRRLSTTSIEPASYAFHPRKVTSTIISCAEQLVRLERAALAVDVDWRSTASYKASALEADQLTCASGDC